MLVWPQKNAILIIEYAKIRVDKRGMNVVDAAIEAAKIRLRPILMTSFAFILGVLPLAVSTGAGSGARTSMGITVVAGMTTATLFGIFIIPMLFIIIETLWTWFVYKPQKKSRLIIYIRYFCRMTKTRHYLVVACFFYIIYDIII